ncbi:unnamed protein product [Orchesella dallaii]|uniref:Protein msta n=1 Tax=Orchesella dallaii TaxID=48710 RepID=A0ABP1Q6C7_9HEXA
MDDSSDEVESWDMKEAVGDMDYDELCEMYSDLFGALPPQYLTVDTSALDRPEEENNAALEYMRMEYPPDSNEEGNGIYELEQHRVPEILKKLIVKYNKQFTHHRSSAPDLLQKINQDVINSNDTPDIPRHPSRQQMLNAVGNDLQRRLDQAVQQSSNNPSQQTPNFNGPDTNPQLKTKKTEKSDPTTKVEQQPPTWNGNPRSGKNNRKPGNQANRKPANPPVDEFHIQTIKQTVNKMKKTMTPQRPYQCCAMTDCKKKASLHCPTCNKTLYCSKPHLKADMLSHERSCQTYKFKVTTEYGKYAVAARDIGIGKLIMVDMPVAVFPRNKYNSLDHHFPINYCTVCCTNLEYNCTTELCQDGCKLRVCKNGCILPKYGATFHNKSECEALSSHYKRDRCVDLRTNGNIIGLIRTVLQKPKERDFDLKGHFIGMSKLLMPDKNSKLFKAKLDLFRNNLGIKENVVSDTDLANIDAAFTRFGRNTGLDVFIHGQYQFNSNKRDLRAFYKEASELIHSCIPNCAVLCDDNSRLYVQSIVEIKKNEDITICYDNRCVFWPSWRRKNHLEWDYAFTCKCKRCVSNTDLGTYFSSFPCSEDSCNTHYIVQENPGVNTSDWVCKGCGKDSISFTRVQDLVVSLEKELNDVSNDAIKLWEKLEDLVNNRYLHWNNFLVFHYSIKFFNLVWEQLERTTTYQWFFTDNGLRFIPAANAVLFITQTFLPFGYLAEHCLGIRVAGLVKMGELSEKIRAEEVDASTVDEFIQATYFRSEQVGKKMLYEITPYKLTDQDYMYLKSFEMRGLSELCEGLAPSQGYCNQLELDCPYLVKMFTFMVNESPTLLAKNKLQLQHNLNN